MAEEELREWRERLPLPEDTSGVLVARSGRIVGMDLFDSVATFGQLKRRLLDASLLDSLRNGRPSRKNSSAQARLLGAKSLPDRQREIRPSTECTAGLYPAMTI